MTSSRWVSRTAASVACALALGYATGAPADTMASFATGGYARGLHSTALMHKMDTSSTGMVTKADWLAFHEKIFAMLDKDKTGMVSEKEFVSPSGGNVATFATGGYARGLRTKEMMHKIDTDGDGTVSHDEFMAYESKVFDMMDTSTTHKGALDKEEFMLATGGYSKR